MSLARPVRRRAYTVCAGAILVFSMLMLAGCFITPKPPTPQTVSVTGRVASPPGAPRNSQLAMAAIDHTPVSGASVVALNFADGKQVGTTATTDQQGQYTISSIPKGISVVIIATSGAGSRPLDRMRLSTLVLDASNSADGNIDGVTSLGAEAWGTHYGKGYGVLAWDFRTTLDAARDVLARLGWLDLTPGGAFLSPEYGGGLQANEVLAPIIDTVPDVIDPLVRPAKEMVQDLRDAGLTIQGTYEQELAGPTETIATEVAPYLEAVAVHVGGLHPYVVMDHDWYPCGVYEEDEYGDLAFVAYLQGPELRWIIRRNDGVSTETWTVDGLAFQLSGLPRKWTTRDLMSTTITFRVENSANRAFSFGGNLVMTSDEATPEMITGAVLNAKLKDPLNPWLVKETTLTGDYEGEFDETTGSVYVEVNGNFTSQYVNASGALTIEGNLSAGGDVRFSGSISAAGITVAGGLDLRAVMNNTVPGTDIGLVPNDVTIRGSISVAGLSKAIFDGTTRIEFENAATFNFAYDPETEPLIRPNNWPKGKVTFIGSVNPRGKDGVSANISITTREYMKFTSSVRYDHGTRWIAGTISFDGANGRADVDMNNQVGLKINMQVRNIGSECESLVATGVIKNASNVRIGDIVVDSDGLVRISYIDGSWESLF